MRSRSMSGNFDYAGTSMGLDKGAMQALTSLVHDYNKPEGTIYHNGQEFRFKAQQHTIKVVQQEPKIAKPAACDVLIEHL